MASNYIRITKKRGYIEANLNLLNLNEHLQIHDLNLSFDASEICTFSDKVALECEALVAHFISNPIQAYDACSLIAQKYQLAPPNPKRHGGYLQSIWARIRAKLNREGLHVYGFRMAELNHDGTPHWHMLFFMEENARDRVRAIIKEYVMQVDGNEAGANKHRFKAVPIEREKGSAVGYIAKYISKNIDDENIQKDLDGNDAKNSAKAIDAWASRWGIRQFQQIGGPSVTVWRELRRLAKQESKTGSDQLDQAAHHASESDWAAYVMVMGGPRLQRSQHKINPMYEKTEFVDKETGEIFPERLTQYEYPSASQRCSGF